MSEANGDREDLVEDAGDDAPISTEELADYQNEQEDSLVNDDSELLHDTSELDDTADDAVSYITCCIELHSHWL